jgi:hypothetical protein
MFDFKELDPTVAALFHTNLKAVAEAPSVASAQLQLEQSVSRGRNDRYAELAYQNAIHNQQLASQSALDHLNNQRKLTEFYLGGLAHKMLAIDAQEAVAQAQLYKGGADASILSILGQINSGGVATKAMALTPPESGVSNAAINTSLAAAIASILTREPVVRDTQK